MSNVKTAMSYSRLVDICTGFGGKYNPGRQTLQLKAMRALLTEAQSSLQDVSLKSNAYNALSDERERAYADVKPLASRIVFTMKALAMDELTLNQARYFLRLISGRLRSQRPPVTGTDADQQPAVSRRITQLSYDAIAANFTALVNLVSKLPDYMTHEEELKVAQLEVKAALLQSMNEKVSRANVAYRNAIMHRNRLLYLDHVSVVNNARRVKSYIRVLYGPGSPEYSQVVTLSFAKPKFR